jgi:hypothetical protein
MSVDAGRTQSTVLLAGAHLVVAPAMERTCLIEITLEEPWMRQNGDKVQSGEGLFGMHLLAASAMRRKRIRRLGNVSHETAITENGLENETCRDGVRQSSWDRTSLRHRPKGGHRQQNTQTVSQIYVAQDKQRTGLSMPRCQDFCNHVKLS